MEGLGIIDIVLLLGFTFTCTLLINDSLIGYYEMGLAVILPEGNNLFLVTFDLDLLLLLLLFSSSLSTILANNLLVALLFTTLSL